LSFLPTIRRSTIVGLAAPVSIFARRRHFRNPIGSMPGAAFRISPSNTRGRSRANCVPR
jgi:hypothetical protein